VEGRRWGVWGWGGWEQREVQPIAISSPFFASPCVIGISYGSAERTTTTTTPLSPIGLVLHWRCVCCAGGSEEGAAAAAASQIHQFSPHTPHMLSRNTVAGGRTPSNSALVY